MRYSEETFKAVKHQILNLLPKGSTINILYCYKDAFLDRHYGLFIVDEEPGCAKSITQMACVLLDLRYDDDSEFMVVPKNNKWDKHDIVIAISKKLYDDSMAIKVNFLH